MIFDAQLQAVAKRIADIELTDVLITQLRNEFAPLYFTFCADDDVNGIPPILKAEKFNLYLIDSREHCLSLTTNYEIATGIVVAEINADD